MLDLLRRIENAGGWDKIADMIADGKTMRYVAACYATDRVTLRRLAREHLSEQRINEAIQDGADGIVEDAREELGEATPETAHLRSTQFNAMLKLAGFLHKDKFGDVKQSLNVQFSIADLHLQAVKQVNAEQRAPALEGQFERVIPAQIEEPAGEDLLR